MNDDFLAFGFLLCHMNLPRQYIHNTEYEVSFYVKLKVSDVIARVAGANWQCPQAGCYPTR
jgi:hypothetical protein